MAPINRFQHRHFDICTKIYLLLMEQKNDLMLVHTSMHTNSKIFCASMVCNTDYREENTVSQMAGLNLVPNLPNAYMVMLQQMTH